MTLPMVDEPDDLRQLMADLEAAQAEREEAARQLQRVREALAALPRTRSDWDAFFRAHMPNLLPVQMRAALEGGVDLAAFSPAALLVEACAHLVYARLAAVESAARGQL